MIEVVTIDTPSLGDRAYLATDGSSALVLDPQRDIDRVLAVAAARGVTVTHVFETHIQRPVRQDARLAWPLAGARDLDWRVAGSPGPAEGWS